MNNVVINVKVNKKLKNNDILVFNGEYWVNLPKEEYIADIIRQMTELQNAMEALENDIDTFKVSVNDKLEQYHNILQVLTKED